MWLLPYVCALIIIFVVGFEIYYHQKIITHLKKIIMTNQEFIEKINTVTAQVGKVRDEVQALKDAIENSDDVPQAVIDAFASLESAVQGVDDINPDAEPPVEDEV